MKVLFLISQMPFPPHQGAAMRNYGLISGLAKQGHSITLLAIREVGKPNPQDTPLAAICVGTHAIDEPLREGRDRLIDLLKGRADLSRRLYSNEMADALRELLDREAFDIIHMDIQSVDYLELLKKAGKGAKIIYDAHNAEYDLQYRIAQQDLRTFKRLPHAVFSLIQARRLKRVETYLCRSSAHIFACSQQDSIKLSELDHSTRVTVIPNAITVENYNTDALNTLNLPHPSIVFTGKMDYRPNVDAVLWFIEDIFPLVKQQLPDSHFFIVGQQPHTRLDRYRIREDITITGFVPDVQPYMREADVYIAPLRMGSGTRFKLLESLAMGSKIVSTHIGAEGLGVSDGVHLLLADTSDDFAAAIVRLVNDPPLGERITHYGRQYVKEHFDWTSIIPEVETAYSSALSES